jgi:hypothetical protein
MKPIAGVLLFAIGLIFTTASTASAQTSDGWWFLKFEDTTGAALQPLNIGIDPGDGSGFSFSTLPDDDGDGVIQLPPLPNGGGLAMGVDVDGEVGCDIWIITGGDATGGTGAQIHHPLLIIFAEDVEGEAFGMDFSPFPFPQSPTRTLVPGERLTATDGELDVWPGLRLVAGPEPADLADFLRSVETWPNFNGDVIVTNFLLTGTFVPEPASWLLLLGGAMAIAGRHRTCRRA